MMYDHKQIQALLITYGELDDTTRRQIDEHLAHCPACAAALAAHRQTDHLLRTWTAQKEQQLRQQPTWSTSTPPLRVRQVMQRARTPRRDHWFFYLARLRTPFLQASVAGVLLVLLGMLVFNFSRRLPVVEPGRVATTTTPPALSATPQQTTIRFALPRYQKGNTFAFVYEFEAANPDLQVELVTFETILNIDDLHWLDPDSAAKVAASADVIAGIVDHSMVEAGLVRDLRPFIQADANFTEEDYYPHALTSYTWQGGLWALPSVMDVSLLFYDKDAFDKAGVAYPKVGWTWEDFAATAQAVTLRKGEEVQQWGYVESWYSPQQFIESQAGPFFDERTTPATSRLLHPAVLAALQRYTELYTVRGASPYQARPTTDTYTESPLISQGRAAMWPDYLSMWQWRKESHAQLGVVPYPRNGSHTRNSLVRVHEAFALSAQSAHPEAAWRWLHFLSTKTSPPYITTGLLPARKSVAAEQQIWEKMDPELATAVRYALEHSYAPSYVYPIMNSEAIWHAQETAFAAILQGQKPVETAMAEWQAVVQQQVSIVTDPPSAQCQITTPSEGATVNGTIILQGTATNPNFAYYQVLYASGHGNDEPLNFLFQESQPVQEGVLGGFDSTIVPDGPYTLSLRVVDQSSNYVECLAHIVVQQQASAVTNPSPARCLARDATITAPAEGATVSGVVTIRGTATDPSFAYYHVLYKSRNGNNKDWGFLFEEKEAVQEGVLGRFDSTILPDGPYTLSLRVVDQSGNYAECLMNIVVQQQTLAVSTPPPAQCQITTPTEGATVSGAVMIKGTAAHPSFVYYAITYTPGHDATEAGIYLAGNNQPVQNGELGGFTSKNVPNGPYTLVLRVVDQTGNFVTCQVNIEVRN
ncbi:MAG: extracellular solute-binding protein [Caldilinea sp. CFX5]|nr:extracellular solute-binding protein [Caldilinea sp. CFX5]